MIKKIISGGQTGADRGALEAGKKLGIETGGTAPKGYRTEKGSDYSLKNFGLIEHESFEYPPRTIKNIQDSDGTVWFGNTNSPGAKLTLSMVNKYDKKSITNPDTPEILRNFIEFYNIKTLNVAGNRESKNPGIQKLVEEFLIKSFKRKEFKK